MDTKEIKISVKQLIDFTLRCGDIDNSFSKGKEPDNKLVQYVQSMDIFEDYETNVYIGYGEVYKGFDVTLDGRISGILKSKDGTVINDIRIIDKAWKNISDSYKIQYWAQAKCYAYMYAIEHGLNSIIVQLTYCNKRTKAVEQLRIEQSIDELEDFTHWVLDKYLYFKELLQAWSKERNETIKNLHFPYKSYRRGQRDLMEVVYRTIERSKRLFAQAPTGVGKTVSTLFPAVKAIGEGKCEKIFYLTAKTITRTVAEESIEKMKEQGLKFKSITLTAKEKICFKPQLMCTPEKCEYAKGHYDRVDEAMIDIFTHENTFTRSNIEAYAHKHMVCPFEFALDLSLMADCIICDYNYVFDPRVYLKRFFEFNVGDYTLLIDEAHNMVDRSREMFSATLSTKPFTDIINIFKDEYSGLANELENMASMIMGLYYQCEKNNKFTLESYPESVIDEAKNILDMAEKWLTYHCWAEGYNELVELYFDIMAYINTVELDDGESYVAYMEKEKNNYKIVQSCIDPSSRLDEATSRGKSAIFFSATLTPLDYFADILGGGEDAYKMQIDSPFDNKNLCLMALNNISTKYKDREDSYSQIISCIKAVIDKKAGNYMVFFPSYKYMDDVYAKFSELYPDIKTILQTTKMSEGEREEFIKSFSEPSDDTLVGFAIMGGIFSEGIDLTGDKLVGAIIVGVGLPQICLERDVIKEYFHKKSHMGYEYAYMYPGFTKVLQAAGRVIRTESDKGVVVLIDERFSQGNYQKLFPTHWSHNVQVDSLAKIKYMLNTFWR